MLARISWVSCAGLIVGLVAASCYQRPETVGLDCDEDAACGKGEQCVDGTCREQCESHADCPDDDFDQLCAAGACIPCTTSCGNGRCCGQGWECCGDGTCGNWERPCGSDTSADTGADSAGDSGGGDEDPDYPKPPCPSGYEQLGNVCLPPCNPDMTCPSGWTGNSSGGCVYNPGSSASPCAGDVDCPAGEACEVNAGGGMTCLGPATHCALFCDGRSCPDQMTCDGTFCVYP